MEEVVVEEPRALVGAVGVLVAGAVGACPSPGPEEEEAPGKAAAACAVGQGASPWAVVPRTGPVEEGLQTGPVGVAAAVRCLVVAAWGVLVAYRAARTLPEASVAAAVEEVAARPEAVGACLVVAVAAERLEVLVEACSGAGARPPVAAAACWVVGAPCQMAAEGGAPLEVWVVGVHGQA